MVFPHFFRFVRVPVVVIVAVAVVVVVVAVVVYLVVLGGTRSWCSRRSCRSRSEGGSPQVRSLKKEVSEKITTGITGLWRPSVHSDVAF